MNARVAHVIVLLHDERCALERGDRLEWLRLRRLRAETERKLTHDERAELNEAIAKGSMAAVAA